MFTGIIQALGQIKALEPRGGDVLLKVDARGLDLTHCQLGDSIAVNGVCLTVTELSGGVFSADVSIETLEHTTLRTLSAGSKVNLEKAVLPSEPLGGHIVSGHVDGVGCVVSLHEDARSIRYELLVPNELAHYIARKGSVCIDGVSLTVNDVNGSQFSVNIIPHTQAETLFHQYQAGSEINIEVDVIARYVERLLLAGKAPEPGLNLKTLQDNGFA